MIGPCLGDKLADWQLIVAGGGHDIIDEKDILDLGPSMGVDAYMFFRRSRSYTMIDSDPEVLLNLRRVFGSIPKIQIFDRNLQWSLPFADESFDTIFDFGTIDNVLAGLEPYKEIWRVLRVGGVFLCSFANRAAFTEDMSACGDEHRFYLDDVINALCPPDNRCLGFQIVATGPRTNVAVFKTACASTTAEASSSDEPATSPCSSDPAGTE